jgi:hypothetical protein
MYRNALIFMRKSFLLTVEIRLSVRQNFSLLISKEKLRDSNFVRLRQLSPTIGQFFASSIAERILRQDKKRPSAPIAQGRSRWPCLCSPDHIQTRPIAVGELLIESGIVLRRCGRTHGQQRSEMVTRRQRRNGSVR